MRKWPHHIWHLPRKLIAAVITGYQHTLSPDHGPLKHLHEYGFCKHEPTCSEYGKQVILRSGILIGIPQALRRILHCTPWAKPSDEKLRKLASRASQ